ncbi:hypothetical protein [Candidatus Methylobacter oryzae]|uniref:Lipocalin-like domain-containing protein n=1 Tax=Candidatus Methylobacter oryzae TaxID=2497749 RepID=A0ABY3CDG3_9GAMM|nr:hypothetical protein [Candidatus Methylobacter oryzae]TRW94652.1 hypothetical protein EKO24_011355 [Candidatus Methylobacter oryzae]
MNRCVKILPLVTIFFTLSANADVQLKDNSEILGTWILHDEAVSLTSPKKAVTQEWEFKNDGTLISSATDVAGRISALKISLKYSIENGEIKKQSAPGREKYESCKVIEKEGSDMILKCTYFFFLTKK